MIYEGDLRANTNDDLLDCFAYDKIEGSLIVESSSVTTIDLPDLVEITGDLVIVFNDFLTDIRGLGSLKKVGGNVRLENNDGLTVDQIENLCQRLRRKALVGRLRRMCEKARVTKPHLKVTQRFRATRMSSLLRVRYNQRSALHRGTAGQCAEAGQLGPSERRCRYPWHSDAFASRPLEFKAYRWRAYHYGQPLYLQC